MIREIEAVVRFQASVLRRVDAGRICIVGRAVALDCAVVDNSTHDVVAITRTVAVVLVGRDTRLAVYIM